MSIKQSYKGSANKIKVNVTNTKGTKKLSLNSSGKTKVKIKKV